MRLRRLSTALLSLVLVTGGIAVAAPDEETSTTDVLGSLAGVEFTFSLEIADANEAIVIEPPDGALPIADLVPVEG